MQPGQFVRLTKLAPAAPSLAAPGGNGSVEYLGELIQAPQVGLPLTVYVWAVNLRPRQAELHSTTVLEITATQTGLQIITQHSTYHLEPIDNPNPSIFAKIIQPEN